MVARYTYDAWGVPTITQDTSNCQIATINPFRYRSYYYDTETNLYYLQSRYYNPAVGRFINADDSVLYSSDCAIVDLNLFAYCSNDPIDNKDISGCFSLKGIFKSIGKYVKFGWGKVTLTLPKVVSIIVGIIALLYRILSIVIDIRGIQAITNDKIATAIVAALPYGSAYVSFEVIAWACNVGAVVAVMSLVLSFVMACCTGALFEIAKTIVLFIISYFAPTLVASIQMIYYGFVKNKGCKYTLNLIGGSSVTF